MTENQKKNKKQQDWQNCKIKSTEKESWRELKRNKVKEKKKEGMIHAAREVRAVLRYLHAASSEYAMHCENKKEQKDLVWAKNGGRETETGQSTAREMRHGTEK